MILVTGGAGLIGHKIVERLSQRGQVRILLRNTTFNPFRNHKNINTILGDISNLKDVQKAFKGVTEVFHLAATVNGKESDHKKNTLQGTENIVKCCLENSVKKLFYFSSLSVIELSSIPKGKIIDENWIYDSKGNQRGLYSEYKLKAEKTVIKAIKEGLKAVILRPGEVLSSKDPHISPAVGFTAGPFIVSFFDKNANIPLIELDDLVEILFRIYDNCTPDGQVFNIVDPAIVSQKQYIDSYMAIKGDLNILIKIPCKLMMKIFNFCDFVINILPGFDSNLSYRMRSAIGPRLFSNEAISQFLLDFKFNGVQSFKNAGMNSHKFF